MISLIVGLGNPGEKYKKTRHNAGFLFVDALASDKNASFSFDSKFSADVAEVDLNGKRIHLIKPQAFMNKSGMPVAAYARYFQIPVEQILVVHDDLDLDLGVLRLKKAGGHGGHNGLRDIFSQLGSKDFYRLRIGIGHPGDSRRVADYVLRTMDKGAELDVTDAISTGIVQMQLICDGDCQKAMQILHTK